MNAAHRAAQRLRGEFPAARIWLFAPHASVRELQKVPADEGERPGIGAALGGVVGGATGFTLATLLVPPAGAIAILAFLGGALGGIAAGETLEDALTLGMPRDELAFYAAELQHGRAVVVTLVGDEDAAAEARRALAAAGATAVDPARERWSIGLRPAAEDAAAEPLPSPPRRRRSTRR